MANISLHITCIIILIIALPIIICYSADKKLRSCLSFFNIIFTLTIILDNLIRFISESREEDDNDRKDLNPEVSGLCKIQAYFLTFFDKFTLTLMTTFSIILYQEKFKKEDEKKNGNKILIILTIISFIISLVCTIVFGTQGISDIGQFCYVENKSIVKKWTDFIVTLLLSIISLIFTIMIFKDFENFNGRKCDKVLFVLSLLINLITFIYVLILIIRALPFEGFVEDLIYILLCLASNLLTVINSELINYIKKIFHCEKKSDGHDDNDNNNRVSLVSQNSNGSNNKEDNNKNNNGNNNGNN